MTIRELIKQETTGLLEVEKLGPHASAEKLVALTSLLASLNAEIAQKRGLFAMKRLELMNISKSAAETKIRAEATEEFNEWQEREEMRKALVEIIRSIKYYLRVSEEEYRI